MSDRAEGYSWEDAVGWLKSQPDKAGLVRDGYYDDPLSEAAERYAKSAEWEAIRCWLPHTRGRALDVGAGRGIASYALARDGFSVTALEPDPSSTVGAGAIRTLADSCGLDITVAEAVSERLPFPDGSFDLVFARAVLHHIDDLEGACREFRRVLSKNGYFIAVREHVISSPADRAAFLRGHPLHHLYGGENALLLREYVTALRGAGFRVKAVLAPLASQINFAPRTEAEVKDELARRIPLAGGAVRFALKSPAAWWALRAISQYFDHRPGRHYSFICQPR